MNRFPRSLVPLILIFLAGCATTKPPEKELPIFYPGPPDEPRIQYLRSFRSSTDIEPPMSAFKAFILGKKERVITLDKPYGVATYKGKIYVCDTNATVMVFDLEQKKLAPLQGAAGPGKLLQPINISIDKDGNKYVADPIRGQVVMFDKNDFYVKAFGPVEGWKPVDAAMFEDRLYVADEKKGEIKVFDIRSGALLNSIGKTGDDAGKLALPTNLAFDKEGYLFVSDPGRFQVVKLDRDGRSRGVVGSLGKQAGNFARPRGVALDRQDRLYAVDAAFNNVQIFSKDGQLLLFFGKGGIEHGDLYLAAKVTLDYDDVKYFQQYADPSFQIEYLILVTSQFGAHPVNVYGFGTRKGQAYKTDEELLKELKERMEKESAKDKQEHPEKTEDAPQKKD